jgi:penicillin-binding protein 1C
MAARGWLSALDYDAARRETIALGRDAETAIAPHFVERILEAADRRAPRRIVTTLDATLQRTVRQIIEAHRATLDAHQAANVAVAVLDNRRSEWLAWEGSGDYFNAEHGGAIDGVVTPRQPGSALKPFTYAAAFERGYHPARVLADVPSQFPTAEPGVLYSPRNYDGQYRGPLSARTALAGSENVPAVALASEIGVPAIARLLRRSGLSTLDRNAAHYGLGLTLGNAEVRLAELVAAYAAFARGGDWVQPTAVLAPVPPGAARETRSLVSARTAYWITDILGDAEAREFIFGRGGSLEFPFPVAVKTGTSQAYHDNWTIGFTRDLTVGVWVGNFDRKPLRNSSGVTGAAPIFHAVMLAAQARMSGANRELMKPGEVTLESREICALSGMGPNAWCPSRRKEWLPREKERLYAARPCDWHHQTDEGLRVVWPAAFRQWAQKQGLADDGPTVRASTPTARAVAAERAAPVPFEIVSPPSGATYLIDPTLRREFQTLPLRVTSDGTTDVTWSIDGRRFGAARSNAGLEWPLIPGTHQIVARDSRGNSSQATITVR